MSSQYNGYTGTRHESVRVYTSGPPDLSQYRQWHGLARVDEQRVPCLSQYNGYTVRRHESVRVHSQYNESSDE